MKKYFHQLTKRQFDAFVKHRKTYKWLAENYPQPKWCTYTDAVMGIMGCWSLTNFMVKNKNSCRKCEYKK